MDNNPVHTTKAMIFSGQINGIFFSARVNPPQPNGTCFFEIHKKAARGGGCSQTVAEHLKGGTQHLSWVSKLQAVSQL